MSNETEQTVPTRPHSRWVSAAVCVAVALPLATLGACSKKDDAATGAASSAYVAPVPAPAPVTTASMPDTGASSPATAASDPMSAMPAASTASAP